MTRIPVLYVGLSKAEAVRCLRALRRAGFAAVWARRGAQAAVACTAGKIRLVIFDLRGARTARRVLQQLDDCGAVVIAIAAAPRGRAALRQGAWDYLDPRDASYVRDLAHTVVRAAAFARLRSECVGTRQSIPEPRPCYRAPRSLADAVVAALAEEITNPLLALRGYSQLLRDAGGFDRDVVTLAGQLDSSVRGVIALVAQLLAALRAPGREGARARVATDFNQLVAAAVQRADQRARRQRRRIELRPARLLPTVILDQQRVARLLDGLLSLALAGVSAGGVIRVATGVQRKQVVLRLESSHAMRAEGIGRVSESAAGTSKAMTTALARVIVGAHGGELTVQGSPGVPLGVTMRLPITETRWAVGQ